MRETTVDSARWRFARAARAPREAQERLLRDLLRANEGTELLSRYGAGSSTTLEEYRRRVPVSTYAELEPYVERIAFGGQNLLTREPPVTFARTSGKTAAPKLIPITRAAHRAYTEVHALWIDAALGGWRSEAGRALFLGAIREETVTAAGIPAGSINGLVTPRALFGRLLTLPDEILRTEPFERRQALAIEMVRSARLELVAAPNPATLINFLGALGAPAAEVWPELRVVGCWTEGPSRLYRERLAALVPGARLQDVGYGASEGFFAAALGRAKGASPMVQAYFFELAEEGSDRIVLIDEAEVGGRYRPIVTTPGGLYRYDMEDVIEVVARDGALPLVRFSHRIGGVSSVAGEKLTETQVVSAFAAAREVIDLPAVDFVARAVWVAEGRPYYRFDVELWRDAAELERFAEELDRALGTVNIEYLDRRVTMRLDPPRVAVVPAGHFPRESKVTHLEVSG